MLARAAPRFFRCAPAVRALSSTAGTYNTLLTEKRRNVAVVTLNRPKALNALCDELIAELNTATQARSPRRSEDAGRAGCFG